MTRTEIKCPATQCRGLIPVDSKDADGIYWCPCHGIKVQLVWRDNKPVLTRVR